ncbi:CHASE2 domain-containing protein [Shimia abyssi]|uniref:CHASE2 domain-containing protein n=1 Tax=Shimia abyssi TaxID=1662395 RepID=A0A2P8FB39_9RHOB|nr:CHASE2 domain-containing protein [Shimia abyssi]PSL18947.1 CHASE2 domain-containing protein [Shimia abyssi]
MPSIGSFARLALYLCILWLFGLPFMLFDYAGVSSRAGADVANYFFAHLYPDSEKDRTAILEVDSVFLKRRQARPGWPPTYENWALIIKTLERDGRPSAIALDIFFEYVRPDEGWESFLSTLCELGGTDCIDPSGASRYCKDGPPSADATHIFISATRVAQFEGESAQADLRRLAQECAHVVQVSITVSESFIGKRLYPLSVQDTNARDGELPSMAVGIYQNLCANRWADWLPQDCERTIAKISRISKADGQMEVFWGIGDP